MVHHDGVVPFKDHLEDLQRGIQDPLVQRLLC